MSSSFQSTQPNVVVKSPNLDWSQVDVYRLILAKYKGTTHSVTMMRISGASQFIMIGCHPNGGEERIEPVTNVSWIKQNLDFVRYYEADDQLVLSGS